MTSADVDMVAELDKKCFSIPWSRQSFAEEMENKIAVYFVATDEDNVIGYCGFWQASDEGDITNIAVLPEYRRKGIGGMLVERLIAEANNMELVLLTLEVRKSNVPAQALYKKYGFVPIGERKRYYRDNHEDALIMMKRLKTSE